ncbi:lipoate--protein ligase [Lentilactobacillus sp. Marseille-Q4993]|uniref:lipoate--protein ligase n=1 Tax=Lentilactobacillus sp. Marseille-Q4993 TaxID=3039492 RepID=UPI0024BD3FC5|nr:lipoate--protein ligase [Lentilactobacillus sp. Marseille-Q4993]
MYLIDTSRNGQPVYDAIVNQSLDNYFVNDKKLPGHGFMMYINQPSVIIGKNQNAWAEVDMDYLHQNDIQLVRRTSGGGAVYHDQGNLVFENILVDDDSEFGNYEYFAKPVLDAIQSLGVDVKMKENSSDLIFQDKKFSGMTMFKNGTSLAAGGTIMYDLNIENAKHVLTEDQSEKAKALGVKSRRSPIINLKEYLPDNMSLSEFWDYLLKRIFKVDSLDDIEVYHMTAEDWAVIDKRIEETYGTDEWNYGKNPGYYNYFDRDFAAGTIGLNFSIIDDKVAHFKLNPFFNLGGDRKELENALVDEKVSERKIKKAVKKAGFENVDNDELSAFIFDSLTNGK